MDEMTEISCERYGVVQIQYDKNRGTFEWAVIRGGPGRHILLTLDLKATWSLLNVCKEVFDTPEELKKRVISKENWADTGFHFMAPLRNNTGAQLFWFSYGPLNSYVLMEEMKTIYHDLKAALDLVGGLGRFMPVTSDKGAYR